MNNVILPASAEGKVVSCEGAPVSIAEILSEGMGSSSGILIIQEDKAYYIANTTPDLKETLEKVIDALDNAATGLTKAASGLSGIGAAAAWTSTPPPNLATDVASIGTAVTAIGTAKTALTTLKEILR